MLKITEYPDVVNTPCVPVIGPPFDELAPIVYDMMEFVKDHNGLGLAAPQIGDFRTFFVMDWGSKPSVFINPKYEILPAPWKKDIEMCYSIPGKRYLVKRPTRIMAKWYDFFGVQSCILTGMTATIFMHEVRHLESSCIAQDGKEAKNG